MEPERRTEYMADMHALDVIMNSQCGTREASLNKAFTRQLIEGFRSVRGGKSASTSVGVYTYKYNS